MDTIRVFPAFHGAVLHGRRYQQPGGDHDQDEASRSDQAQGKMQVGKSFLEHAVELESEQHLRAKDQDARLVEGVLSFRCRLIQRPLASCPGF